MTDVAADVLRRLATSPALWTNLRAISALGGRFAGSEREAAARAFLAERLTEVSGAAPPAWPVDDRGWSRGDARCTTCIDMMHHVH